MQIAANMRLDGIVSEGTNGRLGHGIILNLHGCTLSRAAAREQ